MRWETARPTARAAACGCTSSDEGPGIPDLALALTDGWTSGTGMGLGLSGAKRLVNEFDIDTAPGAGTRVTHHAVEVTAGRRRSRSRCRDAEPGRRGAPRRRAAGATAMGFDEIDAAARWPSSSPSWPPTSLATRATGGC